LPPGHAQARWQAKQRTRSGISGCIRLAGIARQDGARHEETVARLHLAEAALARLDELADRDLRRALNAAEHAELARLYDDGTISQPTRLRLQRGLDLEAARLGDEQH
jgi:hypothetical protein